MGKAKNLMADEQSSQDSGDNDLKKEAGHMFME